MFYLGISAHCVQRLAGFRFEPVLACFFEFEKVSRVLFLKCRTSDRCCEIGCTLAKDKYERAAAVLVLDKEAHGSEKQGLNMSRTLNIINKLRRFGMLENQTSYRFVKCR